jgi:hypothetical protein
MIGRSNGKPSEKAPTWFTQLLTLPLTKSALDNFMLQLMKSSQYKDEVFIRLQIDNLSEENFNPSDTLMYRIKYLSKIHVSPLTLLMFSKALIYYALPLINAQLKQLNKIQISYKQLSDALAEQNVNNSYKQFIQILEDKYENDIKQNKIDYHYLIETQTFADALSRHLDLIKAHQKDLFASLYLTLKFGEYLKNKFNTVPENNIKDELKIFSGNFKNYEMQDVSAIAVAVQASSQLQYGEHEPELVTLQAIQLGAEGFTILLKREKSAAILEPFSNQLLLEAKHFIVTDLIPNSAQSKEISHIAMEIENYSSNFLGTLEDKKETANQLAKKLVKYADSYFLNPKKNADSFKIFNNLCRTLIGQMYKIKVETNSNALDHLRKIIGKIELCLIHQVWINPLMKIQLNKQEIDRFVLGLLQQSDANRREEVETQSEAFMRFYIDDLRANECLFKPTDQLLYRLKFITLIHPSILTFALLNEVVNSRALHLINNTRADMLKQNDLKKERYLPEQKKYVTYCDLIHETFEKQITLNEEDAKQAAKVAQLKIELYLRVDALTKIENIYDCMNQFLYFGEFLQIKFPDTSAEKILAELKIYALVFRSLRGIKPPDIDYFRIASQAKSNFYFCMDLAGQAMTDLQNGIDGFMTLYELDIDFTLPISKPKLASAMYFIGYDLIPNAMQRQRFFQITHEMADFGDKLYQPSLNDATDNTTSSGAIILRLAKSLRLLVRQYYDDPNKDVPRITKLKKGFDTLMSDAVSSVSTQTPVQKEKWEDLVADAEKVMIAITSMGKAMMKKTIDSPYNSKVGTLFANARVTKTDAAYVVRTAEANNANHTSISRT